MADPDMSLGGTGPPLEIFHMGRLLPEAGYTKSWLSELPVISLHPPLNRCLGPPLAATLPRRGTLRKILRHIVAHCTIYVRRRK